MGVVTALRAHWDRLSAVLLFAVGGVLVVGSATQVRTTGSLADQLSYLMSGGVAGLIAGALGGALLLTAGLRDEWLRLHQLEAALPAGAEKARRPAPPVTLSSIGWRAWLRSELPRVAGVVLSAAGLATLLAGAVQVAGSPSRTEQVALLVSGGLGALTMLTGGVALTLAASLSDTEHKLARLERELNVLPPSRRRNVVIVAAPGVAGALTLGMGWLLAAGTASLETAFNGLGIGVLGMLIVAGSLTVWALSQRRSVSRRIDAVLEASRVLAVVDRAGGDRHGEFDDASRWTAPGLRRFHRLSCPAIRFVNAALVTPVNGSRPQLEPCLLCEAGN